MYIVLCDLSLTLFLLQELEKRKQKAGKSSIKSRQMLEAKQFGEKYEKQHHEEEVSFVESPL